MRGAFNPDQIEFLCTIVDEACSKLRCDNAQRTAMAMRVLSFGATGSRDYDNLLALAIYRRTVADEVL